MRSAYVYARITKIIFLIFCDWRYMNVFFPRQDSYSKITSASLRYILLYFDLNALNSSKTVPVATATQNNIPIASFILTWPCVKGLEKTDTCCQTCLFYNGYLKIK